MIPFSECKCPYVQYLSQISPFYGYVVCTGQVPWLFRMFYNVKLKIKTTKENVKISYFLKVVFTLQRKATPTYLLGPPSPARLLVAMRSPGPLKLAPWASPRPLLKLLLLEWSPTTAPGPYLKHQGNSIARKSGHNFKLNLQQDKTNPIKKETCTNIIVETVYYFIFHTVAFSSSHLHSIPSASLLLKLMPWPRRPSLPLCSMRIR